MRARLRDLLRCPACRGVFTVEPIQEATRHGEPDVVEGWLTCGCGNSYPIVRGIPRILSNAPQLFADFYTRHPRTAPATAGAADPPESAAVAGDAGAIAAAVRFWAGAGADTVVLHPPAGVPDPAAFVRFIAEEVRPLIGT